jgi:broad specificity phosphatase PhoE
VETLLLARHALAVSNLDGGIASSTPPGEGLAPEGVEQGRALALRLAGEEVDLGIATELVRTQETLELALAGRDVPRIVMPELNEISFGLYDGGPLTEYQAWAWAERADLPAPGGGESRAQAAARYARALGVLLARPERVVLVIGHALSIRYVLDAVAGLAPAPRMARVAHAAPERFMAREVEGAAALLDAWSRAAVFRDPPDGG